jgi:hypothetical protein
MENIQPTIQESEIEVFDPDKLYHEINLLRIEGYYFNFSTKQTSQDNEKKPFLERIKTPEGFIEKPISIDINPKYGQPSFLAYKILDAIVKKYSDYYYPLPTGVPFTSRELARSIGYKSFGGKNLEQFHDAVMQLRRTGVICSFFDKENKEWKSVDFQILDKVLFSSKEKKIKNCLFSLDSLIVKSLENRYAFCLNYDRIKHLEPVATALFKHVYYHFSHLYSKKKSQDFIFRKDYQDICQSWLGGLKPEKYKSLILSNQLGKHIDKLQKTGLIKKVDIEKNANIDGFNLLFYPGKNFFKDYEHFYCSSPQLQMDFKKANDEKLVQKPMELVSYFYQKLLNTEAVHLDSVDTEYAKNLLQNLSFETVKSLIDYSLEQATKSDFDIKTFRGIKVYRNEFSARQQEIITQKVNANKERDKKLEEAKEKELKAKYQIYQQEEIQKYIDAIGSEEYQQKLDELGDRIAKEQPNNQIYQKREGIAYKYTIGAHFEEEIISLGKVNFLSFENWKNKKK